MGRTVQLTNLFAGQDVRYVGQADAVEVRALAYDSRRVRAGSLFAALSGANPEEFVAEALNRGAVAVLADADLSGLLNIEPVVVVAERPRRALAQAARVFFDDPADQLTVIGVTGTNGKTTVTSIIAHIMRSSGVASGTVGTLGVDYCGNNGVQHIDTELTTPESVDSVRLLRHLRDEGVEAVAMEVSSHALVQDRVSGLAFDVGVFTNLSHDHLDYHGNLAAYSEAKATLFRSGLKPDGVAVYNADDRGVVDALAGVSLPPERRFGFSSTALGPHAKLVVESTRLSGDGTVIDVRLASHVQTLRSPLLGRFNIDNLLAAVMTTRLLGVEWPAIADAVQSLPPVRGRMERVPSATGPLVVVDYAHTPDALDKVLGTAAELSSGRLICVFGCGGDRDPAKRPLMGEAVRRHADLAVLTSDNPRTEDPRAIVEAIEPGLGGIEYWIEVDRAQAIARAIASARAEDTVVIAGKGHEDYQVVAEQRLHFDDKEQALAALRRWPPRGGNT